jgi:hypothetical protein
MFGPSFLKAEMTPRLNLLVPLLAGACIGLAGTIGFGIAHAFLIVPIWRSLPGGIPFALIGGIVTGLAFHYLHASGAVALSFRSGAAFGLLLWLTLVPVTALAAILRLSGMREAIGDWEVVAELTLAFVTGSLSGYMLTRSWRPAVTLGAATLSLTIAMAGPIAVPANLSLLRNRFGRCNIVINLVYLLQAASSLTRVDHLRGCPPDIEQTVIGKPDVGGCV